MSSELTIAILSVLVLLAFIGLLALSNSITRAHKKWHELDELRKVLENEFEKKSHPRTRWGITLS